MYVTEKYGKYDLTLDLKTCGHLLFEMPGLEFCLDCRYLIYIDSKVEKKYVT